jgi:hypothetical protein
MSQASSAAKSPRISRIILFLLSSAARSPASRTPSHFQQPVPPDLDLYRPVPGSDPLFKRELRLTFEDYQVYGATPESPAST